MSCDESFEEYANRYRKAEKEEPRRGKLYYRKDGMPIQGQTKRVRMSKKERLRARKEAGVT
jgi:hypothetical protein